MSTNEVLKLALEALCWTEAWRPQGLREEAINALQEALAQERSSDEQPSPPPECQTEAEKTAYAFGWFKALESVREKPAQQEPVAWRIRCTDPMRDWVLMYRHPRTEEQFSNMEIQPLYTSPPAQQEPVAWMDIDENGRFSGLRYWSEPDNRHEVALYTSPPAQRTWVGLTEGDKQYLNEVLNLQGRFPIIDAIEAKLKEMNT